MKRDLRFILTSLLFVAMFAIGSFAQETTGNIEVTVKDEADAVVPNATVTVEATAGGFKRTVVTNDSGFYRLVQVPPGEYSVVVAPISGFKERRATGVNVGLGKTTPVSIVMGTSLENEVIVTTVAGENLTDDNGNTNLSAEVVALIPKGSPNFSSILKYSAATRPEPRSGQFQIDGASGAENTFIVDGQEVTDISSGFLNRNVNLPLSIIQETQVKTTGFEAEFGGALGGVINIVTKPGTNRFTGEFGVNRRDGRLEPTPYMSLISKARTEELGLTAPAYYPSRRSPDTEMTYTATLLGPIWRDRVWFSAAYVPQIFERERELTYSRLRSEGVLLPPNVQLYKTYRRAERFFGRIDARPFDKLSLNSRFAWTPEINEGRPAGMIGYAAELNPTLQCLGTLCGAAFENQRGGRINSIAINGGGSYLVTSKLVVSARVGHYFFNNKLGTYGGGPLDTPTISCARRQSAPVPGGTTFPPDFGCAVGDTPKYPATFESLFDTNVRDQFEVDGLYSFDLGGRHEVKGGYQRNASKRDDDLTTNDAITLYWGRTFDQAGPVPPVSMLEAISNVPLAMSPTAVGAGVLTSFSSRVNASSLNNSYFVQDRWQPTNRLTLSLGMRWEDEDVPSPFEGVRGLKFGLGSKIAPRIGASYDLTGDGKTRISGFYGLFYDRFKLGGPGRTFAASEVFLNLYFEIFPGDVYNTFNRALINGGGALPVGNSECPTTTTTPVFGRTRCVRNNNTTAETDENLDQNTKPFQQREVTFKVTRELGKNYTFFARYTRKQVINAIEDVSFPLPGAAGNEFFITGNPGKGLIKERFEELGLIAPEAQRQYDALEIRLDRRLANDYFFEVNYTLSRLYGNYSGLISSDEEGGRNDPNVQRVFDTPAGGFTAAGGPDNGRLATDRPHVLKAFGTYTLPWAKFGGYKNHSTDFKLFYTISSGSLITSFINLNSNQQIILSKRGDQGRTPVFSQTDFALSHNIKLGRDGRFNLKLDTDIINLWNQGTLINQGVNPSGQAGNLISETPFSVLDPANGLLPPQCITLTGDPPVQVGIPTRECWDIAFRAFQENGSQTILERAQGALNPLYNAPFQWQAKRTIRYGVTFIF